MTSDTKLVERAERVLARFAAIMANIHYWSAEALPFPLTLPNEGTRSCGDEPPAVDITPRDFQEAAQVIVQLTAALSSLPSEIRTAIVALSGSAGLPNGDRVEVGFDEFTALCALADGASLIPTLEDGGGAGG